MTDYFLLDHPPASRQFFSSRANAATGAVGVHTTEGVLDRIAPDTGAENVAGFISRRSDPGSYAEILDTDSVVPMVPDDYTTFSVAQSGYNSRTWNIALACRADELDPDDPTTQLLIARLGERIRAYWERNGFDPVACARWVGTGGLSGPGLFNHGDVQPQDRSDAWAKHPRRAELDQMLVAAIIGQTPEEDDMTPEQDAILRDVQAWVKNLAHSTGADNPDIPGIIDYAIDTNRWVKIRVDGDSTEVIAAIKALPTEVVAAIKAAL